MRVTTAVCASALVLATALAAGCSPRDAGNAPPPGAGTGGGAAGGGTGGAPATPATPPASAASR
jgi:hypothetical protein